MFSKQEVWRSTIEQKTVTVDGQPIVMTPTEFGILKLLTENAGKVFSMEQIYESVWNEPAYNPENTVAVPCAPNS